MPNDNCVVFVLWLAASIVWFAHHIDHSFCQLSDAHEMILQNEKRQVCVCDMILYAQYSFANCTPSKAKQSPHTYLSHFSSQLATHLHTYTHIWSSNCILLKTERISAWILFAFTGDCFDKQMYFIKIYYRTPCTSNLDKRPYIHITHIHAHSHVLWALKSAKKNERIRANSHSFTRKSVANDYL